MFKIFKPSSRTRLFNKKYPELAKAEKVGNAGKVDKEG
jgi:hypothetical protein